MSSTATIDRISGVTAATNFITGLDGIRIYVRSADFNPKACEWGLIRMYSEFKRLVYSLLVAEMQRKQGP